MFYLYILGTNLKPFFSRLLYHKCDHTGINEIDSEACQTSHNFKFIADLLDLDNPLTGYLCINLDNPFLDCINVLNNG